MALLEKFHCSYIGYFEHWQKFLPANNSSIKIHPLKALVMEEPLECTVVKKKRGRPKKLSSDTHASDVEEVVEPTKIRKRGRPKKTQATENEHEVKTAKESTEGHPLPPREMTSSSAKVIKKRKRNQPNKTAWGRIVGNVPRNVMPGQRLPQNRVVMQRYHTMRAIKNNRTTLVDYANELYEEILPIWKKPIYQLLKRKHALRAW